MATTKVKQNVTPGLREYFGKNTPSSQYDTFEFEFESEMTIHDIAIEMSSTSDSWNLNLIYPTSGITANIASSQSGDWMLNSYSTEKQWFRIPAKTILQWEANAASPTETVTLVVIGQ